MTGRLELRIELTGRAVKPEWKGAGRETKDVGGGSRRSWRDKSGDSGRVSK